MNDVNAAWLVGFVEGEGCFSIIIRKSETNYSKVQVNSIFAIGLHEKDRNTLEKIRDFFGIGGVYDNKQNHSSYYNVFGIKNCYKISKFFETNKCYFQTSKVGVFDRWSHILNLLILKEHLTKEGLSKVWKLREEMNPQYKKIKTYKHFMG